MDFQDLVNGLFPSLKGNIYAKVRLGVAYQLISIGKSLFFRDSIHILLYGIPGTGKTHILKFVSNIPGSLYVNAQTTTIPGLYGYPDRKVGFVPGVISKVSNILCIDELDKANKTFKNSLNELLEDLKVTIEKAKVDVSYDVNLAVLAAANPRKDFFQSKNYLDELDLPGTVIDRFDLIFLLNKSFGSHTEEVYTFDNNELLNYLNKVRSINVQVPENIKVNLNISYTGLYFTGRRVNTIIRLAKAIARSYGDNVVKEQYIEEAIKYFISVANVLLGYASY